MSEMTMEHALNIAIASTEMEGLTVSDEQKALMKKVLSGQLDLSEALDKLNSKYR